MYYQYEFIKYQEGLPIKIFFHSINEYDFHWHNEIEVIFVLKGSVEITIGKDRNILKANDLILLNANEIHSTRKLEDDNILLVLQLNKEFCQSYFPDLKYMQFNCKSFNYSEEDQGRYNVLRKYLAEMIWELNKKVVGYRFNVAGIVHQFVIYLIRNFENEIITNENVKVQEKVLERLQRILDYVKENYMNKISLKEMADQEYLNVYYFSHFFKDKMGITFQDYLIEVRLENAVSQMLKTDNKIGDISYDCGFPNTKSLNKAFKSKYDTTPSLYRKNWLEKSKVKKESDNFFNKGEESRNYLEFDTTNALEILFNQLKSDEQVDIKKAPSIRKKINIDNLNNGVAFVPHWKKLMTFGRAIEGLRANWQSQLDMVQDELGFEHIRFHGIFNDEMMVVNEVDGGIVYNWCYVDTLLDSLVSRGLKPFIELGMMPDALKRSDETIFWYKANISPPDDINKWTDLIDAFMKHIINRYGLEKVELWYFEVWNEPDMEEGFWSGSQQEFFAFYEATANTIRNISKKLKIGGPGLMYVSILNTDWLQKFLRFTSENDVPLDFLSYHIYPEKIEGIKSAKEIGISIQDNTLQDKLFRYYDKNHTVGVMDKTNRIIEGFELETHITEWNASANSRNLIHDTAFMTTYVIYNNIESIGKADSLGFWTFTDIFEEYRAGIDLFHGGFGMITFNGLKKPGYQGYKLLSMLGEEIIEKGDYYIITKTKDDIQILLYNHAYFDEIYRSGDHSGINKLERYMVFEEKGSMEVSINLSNVEGNYKMTTLKFDRNNGSIFDSWVKMGAPRELNEDDLKYLKSQSEMVRNIKEIKLNGKFVNSQLIEPHGVVLIKLELLI